MREMHFRPLYPEEEISFYDSCAHIFTQEVCDTFLRTFNIGKIYLTGLVWQDRLFGLVGIFHGPGETLKNKQAIESFLRQASIAIARRMTEDRLLRSEQRFTDLVASMDLPAIVIAPDGRTSLVNPRFTEVFGYTREDIPTKEAWLEKAFPDPVYQKEACTALNPDYWEAGHLSQEKIAVRCRNGERKNVSIRPITVSDWTQVFEYEINDNVD